MDFSKLIDWVKLSPKYLLAIAVACAMLLFSPSIFLDKLGLTNLVTNIRPWIGVIFVIAITLFVINLAYDGFSWFKVYYERRRVQQARIQRLYKLTPEEKETLLGYLIPKTRTQFFSIKDGVIKGLEAEGIIFMASNVGDPQRWAYNIQPWAWDELNKQFGKIFSQNDMDNFNGSEIDPAEKTRKRTNIFWGM